MGVNVVSHRFVDVHTRLGGRDRAEQDQTKEEAEGSNDGLMRNGGRKLEVRGWNGNKAGSASLPLRGTD
jgi:hypothetical protein